MYLNFSSKSHPKSFSKIYNTSPTVIITEHFLLYKWKSVTTTLISNSKSSNRDNMSVPSTLINLRNAKTCNTHTCFASTLTLCLMCHTGTTIPRPKASLITPAVYDGLTLNNICRLQRTYTYISYN